MSLLKNSLFIMIVIWTVWLIVKSIDTLCFNLLDSWVTIILLYEQMFLNEILKGE